MISVVIPTYNRRNVIERSVRSVLNQDIQQEIEVIVSDDCSTDDTLSVLEHMQDQRIKIVRAEKQGGACRARNRGIAASSGEWIALQDSDDEWLPEKLQIQLKAMEQYHAEVCFCQMNRQGFQKQNHNGVYPCLENGIVSYQSLCSRFQASCQTIIAKRQVFETIKFDENAVRFQDFDWIVRAGKNFKVCAVAQPLVNVYLQNDSITSYHSEKLIRAYEYFIDKYSQEFDQNQELYAFLNREYGKVLALSGQNAVEIFHAVYQRTKSKKDLLRYLLAKGHLLPTYYRRRK